MMGVQVNTGSANIRLCAVKFEVLLAMTWSYVRLELLVAVSVLQLAHFQSEIYVSKTTSLTSPRLIEIEAVMKSIAERCPQPTSGEKESQVVASLLMGKWPWALIQLLPPLFVFYGQTLEDD